LERTKQLEKALEAELAKQAANAAGDLAGEAESLADGVKMVAARIQAPDMDKLRQSADGIRDKIGSGVVALAAESEGKVMWVVMATKDVVARGIHAGKLIKEAASITGGGGGGRPDMAQAGGKDASRIDEALDRVRTLVKEIF
jgi:alanyl-tRNA synthetase